MTQDITGFGIVVNLVASSTFPTGITLTQFADDSDPVDLASVRIADVAMGANGDLLTWAKAIPLPAVLNVVAGSDDDINLQILADANRVAQGKASAGDIITMTIVYPDLSSVTLIQGRLTDSAFGKSIAGSSFRMKTKSYAFSFQDKVGI
jgi:hypothetical protein